MSDADIHLLTMPKWGLAMTKGQVVGWLIEEGAEVRPGLELVEIETEKVLSAIEAATSGVLRRKVARQGDVVHVGGLLGVIADPSASDSQIDHDVEDFQAHYIPRRSRRRSGGSRFFRLRMFMDPASITSGVAKEPNLQFCFMVSAEISIPGCSTTRAWPQVILFMLWICLGMGVRRNKWKMEP